MQFVLLHLHCLLSCVWFFLHASPDHLSPEAATCHLLYRYLRYFWLSPRLPRSPAYTFLVASAVTIAASGRSFLHTYLVDVQLLPVGIPVLVRTTTPRCLFAFF